MTSSYARRHKASSWLIGLLVLAAIGAAVPWMFSTADYDIRDRNQGRAAESLSVIEAIDDVPQLMVKVEGAKQSDGVVVRGLVVLPDGAPAASATVTLYKLVTAWPEWQMQRVDEAITREDGAFQFRSQYMHGHLLGYAHPLHAGGQIEVSPLGDAMLLPLRHGFSISGLVINDIGAPVPNARVSVESVPGGQRRARFTHTAADGSYTFSNLEVGPAQLVARHDSWQPVKVSGLVIGDRIRSDFRFERPSMSPLRGRVVSAITQEPVVGATVELIPIRESVGLSDPLTTLTDASGRFLMEGLPTGSMRMRVRHPDYGQLRRTQRIGAVAHDVTLELAARTKLRGRLAAAEDGVIMGGEILEVRDVGNELAFAVVSADGSFEFQNLLSPGFAEIRSVGGVFAFPTLKGLASSHRLSEQPLNDIEVDVVKPMPLRGRFVDAKGAPISGVRVSRTRLLSDSVKLFGDAAWQLDFGKVGDGIAQLMDVDRDELLALSGNDGSFEIRGFRRGALLARVARRGFGSGWLRMTVPSQGEADYEDLGEIRLTNGCSVSGSVLRGGQPFVGATVVMVSSECQSTSMTDAQGVYKIEDLVPGEYSVIARIAGRRSGSQERKVTVTPSSPSGSVDIDLEIGRMVKGFVKNEQGQPLKDALVSVRGRPGEVTQTDVTGMFEVELPRRVAELAVSFGDRANQKVVSIGLNQKEVTVLLDTPPTSTLVASVVGLPSRRRIPGVLLRVTKLASEQSTGVQTRWVATPAGELHKAQVPSGKVRIEIWCDGFAPYLAERQLKPNEDNDLGEVLLTTGASLHGIVRDVAGNSVADAQVLLGEETDMDLYLPSVRSNADGTFVIQGVTSRSSQLVIRHSGFAASTVALQLPRDVLSPQPLLVTLQRGMTIEVVVPAEHVPEDGLVYLRRGGLLLGSTLLDDKGYAWFGNRSAGNYTVKVFGSDLPERQVNVEPGVEVTTVDFGSGRK